MSQSTRISVDDDGFVQQEMLEDGMIEAREYQLDLVEQARDKNALVVLPTGLGKTPIAVMLAAERYAAAPERKILMLAPTKPLVNQHAETFEEFFWMSDDRIVTFTGDTPPSRREQLWSDPDTSVVIATPQCLKNDVTGNRIDISDVSHLIFDECHRATGDYAYNDIAARYHQDVPDGIVTALSASPGSSKQAVLQVCYNLGIDSIHVKTESDPSVREYNPETTVDEHWVELTDEMTEIRDLLQDVFQNRLEQVKDMGVIDTKAKSTSNRKIQGAKSNARELINSQSDSDQAKGYKSISLLTEAQKLNTAIETIEGRGPEALRAYFDRMEDDDSKAAERMMSDDNVREARDILDDIDRAHPKMIDLISLVSNVTDEDGQVIVFADSRDAVEAIVDFLTEFGVNARRFVGQSDHESGEGMTQREQNAQLDEFRDGAFNVLVSTQVSEEGLDIPAVDLVLFYEPVASPVRSVQRKGRTGREKRGRVIVMLTRNTGEVGKWYALKNREDTMAEEMDELKEIEDLATEINAELSGVEPEDMEDDETDENATLDSFMDDEDDVTETDDEDVETPEDVGDDEDNRAVVIVDNRELQSDVGPTLNSIDDVVVELETLDVGDYVLSNRVAVERKSMEDFLDTLIGGDRDLFEQLGDLSNNYSRPILLLEGDMDDLFTRNIPRNAIYGALAAATVGFDVSIMHSRSEEETARILSRIAVREQQEAESSEVSAHGKKSGRTRAEQQEYVVSSMTNVGPVTARALLDHFGSVRAVMTASVAELQEVEGVGQTTAENIRSLLDEEYDPR